MKYGLLGLLTWVLVASNAVVQGQNDGITADKEIYFIDLSTVKNDAKDERTLFVPDQLAVLMSNVNPLIGNVVSPLSGNLCLRETDLKVVGAQEIILSRVYIAPFMPYFFPKH
jgi:hypothetical protein